MSQTHTRWIVVMEVCKKGFARFADKCGQVLKKYGEINGDECAASFAYYAFFSLFPLILLLVAIGTLFVPDRYEAAHRVVQEVEQYIPLQPKDHSLLLTMVDDAIQNGWRAGIFGLLALLWGALRFFQALVIGINRAWGGKNYNWWKLPLKNLLMFGILASTLLLGLAAPLLVDRLRTIHYLDINAAVGFFSNLLPVGILFYGLAMLYKFAPRRPVKFRRVWLAALLGTVFLQFGTHLFTQYLASFTNFNALYGAFATIMGLLLWIYYTGVVLLLGGCISATTGPPDAGRGKIQTAQKASGSDGGTVAETNQAAEKVAHDSSPPSSCSSAAGVCSSISSAMEGPGSSSASVPSYGLTAFRPRVPGGPANGFLIEPNVSSSSCSGGYSSGSVGLLVIPSCSQLICKVVSRKSGAASA